MNKIIQILKFLCIQNLQNLHLSVRSFQRKPEDFQIAAKLDPKMKNVNHFLGNFTPYTSNTERYEHLLSFSSYSTKCNSECEKEPLGRHKFHKETEDLINKQIFEEFSAAYAYLSMASYFGKTDIALPGCQGYFTNMFQEEIEHGIVFANYLLMRGAQIVLLPINPPENQNWISITKAFTAALALEKSVKEKLCCIFDVAEKHKDLQVMDLISTEFMDEQNRSICQLARLLTRAKMTENSVGEYLFDQMIYESFVKKSKENLMYKQGLDKESKNQVYS